MGGGWWWGEGPWVDLNGPGQISRPTGVRSSTETLPSFQKNTGTAEIRTSFLLPSNKALTSAAVVSLERNRPALPALLPRGGDYLVYQCNLGNYQVGDLATHARILYTVCATQVADPTIATEHTLCCHTPAEEKSCESECLRGTVAHWWAEIS